MGQAAIELPEPPEQATPPTPASADDLLSQLAGEEVDRMLADAESSPGLSAPAAPVVEPALPGQKSSLAVTSVLPDVALVQKEAAGVEAKGLSDSNQSSELVEAASSADGSSGTAPVVAAAQSTIDSSPSDQGTTGSDGAVQDQLDALFNELTGSEGSASVEASAGSGPTPINQQQVDQIVTQESGTDQATTASGTDVASLNAELVASLDSAEPSPAQPVHGSTVESEAAGEAWYILLLEKLNAPFAAVSPELRGLLGKVAIVTAFNAAVILVYVLMFRG